eukprot:TRINITY_DN88398_c0_g1_i1.p2 TRINITY_DN88398_c0_g1~~TRINITY_DN88398_c0_g1_i1.p2  ORF type:complete len:449 (+),score=86.66 TRINITY_DN88398_c0_g1_i1:7142-8488(+)
MVQHKTKYNIQIQVIQMSDTHGSKGGITESAVFAAADAIAAAGQRPTQALVREHLGGGSFATIGPALKKWREAQWEQHELAEVELPGELDEALQQLGGRVWQAAIAAAEAKLVAEREALAAAREALEAEAEEQREAVAQLEAEAEQHEQQMADMAETLALANQRSAEEQQQIWQLQAQVQQLQAEREGLVTSHEAWKVQAGEYVDDIKAAHAQTVAALQAQIADLRQRLGGQCQGRYRPYPPHQIVYYCMNSTFPHVFSTLTVLARLRCGAGSTVHSGAAGTSASAGKLAEKLTLCCSASSAVAVPQTLILYALPLRRRALIDVFRLMKSKASWYSISACSTKSVRRSMRSRRYCSSALASTSSCRLTRLIRQSIACSGVICPDRYAACVRQRTRVARYAGGSPPIASPPTQWGSDPDRVPTVRRLPCSAATSAIMPMQVARVAAIAV